MNFKIQGIVPAKSGLAVFYNAKGQPFTRPIQAMALIELENGESKTAPTVFIDGAAEATVVFEQDVHNYLGICEGSFNPEAWQVTARQMDLIDAENGRMAKLMEVTESTVLYTLREKTFKPGAIVAALAKTQYSKVSQEDAEDICHQLLAAGKITKSNEDSYEVVVG